MNWFLYLAWMVVGFLFGACALLIVLAPAVDRPRPWDVLLWPTFALFSLVMLSW